MDNGHTGKNVDVKSVYVDDRRGIGEKEAQVKYGKETKYELYGM